MRSLLGRVVALSVAVGIITVGASGAAATPPDPTTETAVDSTVVDTTVPPEPVEIATTTTSTTTTTTTTTAPQPLVVEVPAAPSRVTPERGAQVQVTPTDPPPVTTTTTTVPSWLVLPANSGSGRRVVYHKSRQRVWTVEADGRVSKTHPVSGRLTWDQPSPGTYSVFSRSSYTCNIKNPYICWRHMVRFAKGPGGDNIGFHEIPTDTRTGNKLQSLSQLGTPLSGGCVRQGPNDAIYMWNWAPIGTKVVVIQ